LYVNIQPRILGKKKKPVLQLDSFVSFGKLQLNSNNKLVGITEETDKDKDIQTGGNSVGIENALNTRSEAELLLLNVNNKRTQERLILSMRLNRILFDGYLIIIYINIYIIIMRWLFDHQ